MKQLVQNLSNGVVSLLEAPAPAAGPGRVLVRTQKTLISSGTERMLVEFGKAGWIDKARQQPDKVRQVLDKVRTDGLLPTLEAVRSKLEQPLPLGYCNVGTVIGVGEGVSSYAVGDRVVSNGWHAEVVAVPANLCARIPDMVSDDAAAFTVIGAIALQGLRLAQPTLGEDVAVIGLGLVGLLTVQLLRAQGCRVLGVDLLPDRLALARRFGAETVDLSAGEDPVAAGQAFSRGRGLDAVLIAAATDSSEPVRQAARMCRKRGRIVLVGVAGVELSRTEFYEKELTFQVSCSYGPGRYDPAYELKGQDYPIGFVRWTAQRNFEAVLELLAEGRLDVAPLISHRFPIDEAERAYTLLERGSAALGMLLTYPSPAARTEAELRRATVKLAEPVWATGSVTVAVVGAGSYATRMLIPALCATGVRLKAVVSANGVSAAYAGRKFEFELAGTDPQAALADPEVNAVVIATRHDSHACFVCQALEAGKHIFVEKPLALTLEELDQIAKTYSAVYTQPSAPLLMVGFNRRFAPHIRKMKELLDGVQAPKSFVMTINAGEVPPNHWTRDPHVGGGRIIGEGCHFIDLLRFLAGHPVTGVQTTMLGRASGVAVREDTVSFTLTFADGSFGTVHYLANGHKSFPKERLEVFCDGRVLQLDNFRRLRGYGWPDFKRMHLWRQDKGHQAEVAAFIQAIQNGDPSPIPFEELVEVTRVSFEVAEVAAH